MTVDAKHMQQALELAANGRGRTSPNPMVGAVIVNSEDQIVGTGYHERAGGPHAEIKALQEAGKLSEDGTLYVTLEPCCHRGRTGPCTDEIIAARIKRVVVATLDPNPIVQGNGAELLRQHRITVDVGVCAKEARELNFAFFTWILKARPFVVMKIALSLDGCFGRGGQARTKLTSAIADSHVHGLRAEIDGIAVGSNTVIVDDPLLTARHVIRDRPLTRVVFDRRLRVSPSARLFGTREAGPIVVVSTDAQCERKSDRVRALRDVGADIETVSETDDLGVALRELGRRELTYLVVEGGKTVHHALWRDRHVDRVQMFIAPIRLGVDGTQWLNRDSVMKELSTVNVANVGPDVLVEGNVYWNH